MLRLDHIAISSASLDRDCRAIEADLGVALSPGGEHEAMGTHNRLLSLGPDEYLEVIAINPDAPAPAQPRWFDLDNFGGAARVTNWICRAPDLPRALEAAPDGAGKIWDLERGDLKWRMGVPVDGKLPYDGCFPALIEWQGEAHPAPRLPDLGVRLTGLVITHPNAEALQVALDGLISDDRLRIEQGPTPRITAELDTPNGSRQF